VNQLAEAFDYGPVLVILVLEFAINTVEFNVTSHRKIPPTEKGVQHQTPHGAASQSRRHLSTATGHIFCQASLTFNHPLTNTVVVACDELLRDFRNNFSNILKPLFYLEKQGLCGESEAFEKPDLWPIPRSKCRR
jgi:hypothetical protein